MFIIALVTIAEIWKQPRCPSTDDQIKKGAHTQNRILHSNKKNKILPFETTWMDLEGIMLSEIRQIPYGFPYIWNLKKQKPTNQQNKNRLIEIQTKGTNAIGEVGGWIQKVRGNIVNSVVISLHSDR